MACTLVKAWRHSDVQTQPYLRIVYTHWQPQAQPHGTRSKNCCCQSMSPDGMCGGRSENLYKRDDVTGSAVMMLQVDEPRLVQAMAWLALGSWKPTRCRRLTPHPCGVWAYTHEPIRTRCLKHVLAQHSTTEPSHFANSRGRVGLATPWSLALRLASLCFSLQRQSAGYPIR
jgi:hypothetical protein